MPVIEAELALDDGDAAIPAGPVAARLAARFGVAPPAAATHADVLLFAVQFFQARLDVDTKVGFVRPMARTGGFRIIFGYDEDTIGESCLHAAFDALKAAAADAPFDTAAVLAGLRDHSHEVRLGPSTRSIVDAARRRGIPTRRLNDMSLVQLGWGVKQKRIWTAETDETSALAEVLAQDKQLTRKLLKAVGVPVPYGRPVNDADDAWAAAEEIGLPVVVKPQFGNQGRGVATNLGTREQVIAAYTAARHESENIVVESYLPGRDYRVLVVGGKVVAAAVREPAHVVGDGRSTVRELIVAVNADPRRSDGHSTPLSFIKIDAVALGVLADQGYSPDAVPPTGQRVLIRRNANLSTGGTAADVTDLVHPLVVAHCVDAAKAIGLDIAGIDVVAEDISQPLPDQHGGIVEVNAGPGLRMHLEPSSGTPRDVGAAIVDTLFPPGETARIPVVAVTGTNGKTTTSRLLAHLCAADGRYVGLTCTDGIYLAGRRVETRDCSGPQSARTVLLNPRVETAVLETARGGILREGLGFDRADVTVVTNLGSGDHLGLRGIDTLEELAAVKSVVPAATAPDGTAVLNAADPLVVAMAARVPGRVLFFAQAETHPVLSAHRAGGGAAAFLRAGGIVLSDASGDVELLPAADVPCTRGGRVPFQVENALAAAAAAWRLGVPVDAIRAGLRSFAGSADEAPGRFNVFESDGATVVVDYAHNPSAVAALVAGLDAFPHPHRTLVFSGCNRRDEDLLEMGRVAGDAFDRVILYADRDNSDRADGELNAVLRKGLAAGCRVRDVSEEPTEHGALERALGDLAPGRLVVLGVEAIEESLTYVRDRLERAPAA
ncbi:MAG: cyanophycin synthetase [Fimbriiglobus sp.]